MTAVERPPVIEVVGSEHGARELGERVRVFVEQPSTREERHAATLRPLGDPREDLVERGRLEPAIADQRRGDATRQVGVTEREPPLVARPGVVHLRVLSREDAHDRSSAQVDPDVAACAAVLAHGVRRREVERPRDETVRLGGERSDRADLHRVAGERRTEVLARCDRHAFGRASSEQLDEPVAADLVAETRAARAQHTAFAVELDERRERDRLLVRPPRLRVPALAGAERHRLVLQRALAAPVADRAVERVVQEQELEVRHLGTVRLVRGVLGPNGHAGRDLGRARREELALAFDLHVALPARADRIEEGVVAEPRDLDPEVLGGPDDQRPLRDADLLAVDGERDELLP